MYFHVCDHIFNRMIDSLREEIVSYYSASGKLRLPDFIGAGKSGNEIVEKITGKLKSEKQDFRVYQMDVGGKGKNLQELIFDDVTDRSILICDSIVNTGSTLNNMRKFLMNKGAKDVKTLTLFLRNGAMLIPNFYVTSVDKYDEVIFNIKKYPINFYAKGHIRLLNETDSGKKVNSGKSFISEYYDDYLYNQKVNDNCCSYVIEDSTQEPVGIIHIIYNENRKIFIDTVAVNKDKKNDSVKLRSIRIK